MHNSLQRQQTNQRGQLNVPRHASKHLGAGGRRGPGRIVFFEPIGSEEKKSKNTSCGWKEFIYCETRADLQSVER